MSSKQIPSSAWTESFLYRVGEVDWSTPDILGGINPKVSAMDDGTLMAVAVRGKQNHAIASWNCEYTY